MEVVKATRGIIGAVKSPTGIVFSLLLILSVSWFADGLSGLVEWGEREGFWRFWLVLSLLLLSMLLLFFIIREFIKCYKSQKGSLTSVFGTILLINVVSFILMLLIKYSFLHSLNWLAWSQIALSSIAFASSIAVAREFLDIEVLAKKVDKSDWKKFKVVIVFLSDLEGFKNSSKQFEEFQKLLQENEIDIYKFVCYANEWKKPYFPWEMQVRLIHEIGNVEYVYVIVSDKSVSDKELFKELLDKMFKIKIHFSHPIDFSDFEQSIEALNKAYDFLRSEGFRENQIVIDTTGGQKLQSVAGGFIASGYDRYFAYVDTNTKKVKIYDVQLSL